MFDKGKLADVKAAVDKFDEKTSEALKKRPERQETFYTGSGDEIDRYMDQTM